MIHGLTGTPGTVASLKDALLAANYVVSTPCLAGHGGSIEDLSHSSWREWYETVRIAYHAMRKDVEKIYCAGISLGALLTMKLALDEGWGVRALALLSTPLRLSKIESLATLFVRHTPLRWIIKAIPKDPEKSVADPDGRRIYDEMSLSMIPSKSVFEISDLSNLLIKDANRLTNPILLLHGKNDCVAPLKNVKIIQELVSSDIVETTILPLSRHVITLDFEKQLVAKSVVDFFNRFE